MAESHELEYHRPGCLGDAVCTALFPDNWFMDKDGKASPRSLEIGDSDIEMARVLESLCPAGIIKLKKR